MEYADYVRRLGDAHANLAPELAAFRGLGGVMAWMQGRGIALADVEIIQQDEFSLDFLVPLTSCGAHVAFGIT